MCKLKAAEGMKKKCLIFFTIGIGDSLMVTPVISRIKDMPEYQFDALTISTQVQDIMQNSFDFHSVHLINFLKDDLWESLSALRELRKEKYDISVLVFPSNHFKYQLVHYLIGAKKRYGMSYLDTNFPDLSFMSGKLLKEDRSLHAIEQNFRLFEHAFNIKLERTDKMKINLGDRDRKMAGDFIKTNDLEGKTLIGMHPGSDLFKNMERKRWGFSKYCELIQSYSANKDIHFLLFGGKQEKDLNEEISSNSKNNTTVVKNTVFFQSAALIEMCKVFICGDTGLMHTASTLNVPVIAIFGPTNPVYTRPLNPGSLVVKKDYPCMPCYEYSRTPLYCDQEQQYKCMEDISVNDVKEILDIKINKQEM